MPLLIIVFHSFNPEGKVLDIGSYSLYNYVRFFQSKQFVLASKNSLKIAFVSATIATVLGTLMSVAICYGNHLPAMGFVDFIFNVPLIIPDLIIGLGMALVFSTIKMVTGYPESYNIYTVIIAHATIGMAYVRRLVQPRLMSIGPSFLDAAMNLKCRPMKAFFVITLPSIKNSIILGWVLSFIISFDDPIVSSFVSGPDSVTIPMLILSSLRFNDCSYNVNVLCSIIMAVLSFAVLILFILRKRWDSDIS